MQKDTGSQSSQVFVPTGGDYMRWAERNPEVEPNLHTRYRRPAAATPDEAKITEELNDRYGREAMRQQVQVGVLQSKYAKYGIIILVLVVPALIYSLYYKPRQEQKRQQKRQEQKRQERKRLEALKKQQEKSVKENERLEKTLRNDLRTRN